VKRSCWNAATDHEIWVKHRISEFIVCFAITGGAVEDALRGDLESQSRYDRQSLIPLAHRTANEYLKNGTKER